MNIIVNYLSILIVKIRDAFRQNYSKVPLIDRWIISELVTPLLFAIASFTVVSLSVGILFELVRQIVEIGLPVFVALKILFFRLPSFIVISFPMAMLLATLLTYGRLSENSELKALRSIGISTYRFVIPALVLSFFMSILTFFFNNNIVPAANAKSEVIMQQSLDKAFTSEQGEDIIYSKKGYIVDQITNDRKRGVTHLFYAWKFINGKMLDVTVIDYSKLGYTQVLKANSGVWNSVKGKWEFFDGTLLSLDQQGETTRTTFDSFVYPLGIELAKTAQLPKDARDMTLSQAFNALQLYKESGNIKESRRMQVRIQEKFTLPIACSVFALVGCSLGSKSNIGSSRSQGFGLSIVLILFYYILSFSFSSLGVKGVVNPSLSAWFPVLFSILGGSFLLRQSAK